MTSSISGLSTSLATLLGQSSSTSSTDSLSDLIYTKAAKTSTAGTANTSSDVSISSTAKLAAANAKDFATVGNETRATLDAQTTAGKPIDMSELSGRALASVMLDKDGKFTAREKAAAKTELNNRTRDEFTSTVGSSASLTSLSSYNQLIVSEYDSMSDEERQARGWSSATRASAAGFIATASATSTTSLFDMLNDDN